MYDISIHTVPKDSDLTNTNKSSDRNISIHTVPKDSDTAMGMLRRFLLYFNPHRPEGQWRQNHILLIYNLCDLHKIIYFYNNFYQVNPQF